MLEVFFSFMKLSDDRFHHHSFIFRQNKMRPSNIELQMKLGEPSIIEIMNSYWIAMGLHQLIGGSTRPENSPGEFSVTTRELF